MYCCYILFAVTSKQLRLYALITYKVEVAYVSVINYFFQSFQNRLTLDSYLIKQKISTTMFEKIYNKLHTQ